MYIASGILFIIPCLLLFFAGRGLSQGDRFQSLPKWRKILVKVALLVASASTILNLFWNLSWLHNGGSPHGMSAGPGVWQSLGPFLVWTFIVGTILILFWAVSMVFVYQAIYILQFD